MDQDPVTPARYLVRHLGLVDYVETWQRMMAFTDDRTPDTVDEIWFLEHPPVYTQGLNGRREHVLDPGAIPVIQVDRGGQITYHGPGQLVVYPLLDMRRLGLGPLGLVRMLERATLDCLAEFGIAGHARPDAPGVYVESRKIASIGLRIRRGGSYHGLALNISVDLEPFRGINPCGYRGLEMTRLTDLGGPSDLGEVMPVLERHLEHRLIRREVPAG
ncbi:lipoyltransferase [mine drainage metagenome]|uniref:lipoyl(octanoyl) transferase n=2 Tax=mine drainage metagenome TaxID=410659 RepID=T1BPN6_9ZZZZ